MTAYPNDGPMLQAFFRDNGQELLDFIRWLVEQESMTGGAEALTALARQIAEPLTDSGATVELPSDPNFGTTLIARFGHRDVPGEEADSRQLLVVGHLDTVWPPGTLGARPFRIEDGRAYGPGIFDMKAGVAVCIFAMRALRAMGRPTRRPVTLILACDEEGGSYFSRELIEAEARSARAALVFEPPIPGGRIKTGRKGVGQFELTVRGRPAHAGNDPQAGINAITELAHQVLAINLLNDYKRGTTLNVGVARGGVLSTVVPAEAEASIDLRFETVEEGRRAAEALADLKPVLDGAILEIRGGINRPPMVRTQEVGKLFEHARGLAAEFGLDLKEGSVGGGSDGNFIAALGVPVLDGLGVDGAGAHAHHEHIIIDDISRCASLAARLIETI
jgi:glutamate carboxypeptidase